MPIPFHWNRNFCFYIEIRFAQLVNENALINGSEQNWSERFVDFDAVIDDCSRNIVVTHVRFAGYRCGAFRSQAHAEPQ